MNDARQVTWLTSFSHFITHGYMSLLPALLVVIASEHSMSFLAIGIIANIGYFLYGLGSFPAGLLADRFGSKRVLSIGVLGMAVSSILIGVSPGIIGFAVAYALLGTFASIHHPAGLAFIARRVTEKKGKALGLHGVLGNVGLFMTPLVAGLCVFYFASWRAAYIFYGIIGLGFFAVLQKTRVSGEVDLAFALGRRPSADPASAPASASPSFGLAGQQGGKDESIVPVALLLLFVGSILSGFIFRGSLTFLPTLLQREVLFVNSNDQPVVVAGFMTTAVLSFGLVGAWFGGWINDRVKKQEFVPAIVFAIVTPLLYLMSKKSDNSLIVAGCLFSLVYYAWQPAQNYLIARYTRASSHGKGFGVNFFFIFGMGSVATATGGYFVDTWGVDYFYGFMAYISAAACAVALLVYGVRAWRFQYTLRLVRQDVIAPQ